MIPFKSWLPLLILVGVAGLIFRMPWLVVFSISILLIFSLAQWWNRQSLQGIKIERTFRYRRGFAGEPLDFTLLVENEKWLPVNWLKIEDRWPYAVGPEQRNDLMITHLVEAGNLVNLYSLRWRQKTRREFKMLFHQRGLYEVGPMIVQSGDPFGLFSSENILEKPEYLTVFPDLLPLSVILPVTEDPFGEKKSRKRVFEDPTQPMGIRGYTPEDEFRRIHWPATARTGELQVKVYPPVSSKVLMICMNAATTTRPWLGSLPRTFEQMIKVCASIAYESVQKNYQVGLISNGSVSHSDHPFRVPPGRSQQQLATLLQTLAAATDFITAPFEQYLLQSLGKVPMGSALVVVSACTTDTLLDTLIRLRKYRSNITLVALDPNPPADIPGLKIVPLPFEE